MAENIPHPPYCRLGGPYTKNLEVQTEIEIDFATSCVILHKYTVPKSVAYLNPTNWLWMATMSMQG